MSTYRLVTRSDFDGLGRFRDFRISNYNLMMDLIAYCKDYTIDEILQLPDVVERTELYFDHDARAREQIERCSTAASQTVLGATHSCLRVQRPPRETEFCLCRSRPGMTADGRGTTPALREETTMTWLDDQGIAHDGEPPVGYRMLGGRWYPIDAEIDMPHRQTVRELLAAR